MSTAKGRRMAFIHILFLYFSFPEACGQGGTIVCEGYYYFFNLRSKSCWMNFLQSIVSIATVTVFYFHMYHLELVDNNNYSLR